METFHEIFWEFYLGLVFWGIVPCVGIIKFGIFSLSIKTFVKKLLNILYQVDQYYRRANLSCHHYCLGFENLSSYVVQFIISLFPQSV